MKKVISIITALLALGSITGIAAAREARSPSNDAMAAAAAIPALPFSQTVSLRGATLEAGEVQPSCKKVSGSVWFAFSVPEESNIVTELSSTSGSAVAVFEQGTDALTETACAVANSEATEFKALPDRVYLVQVGSTGRKQGVVDLGLRLSEWVDRTIWEYSFHRDAEEQHVPVLSVKGNPRADNPNMYDVEIGISQQQPIRTGVLTFGLVTHSVQAELLRIPPSTTDLQVRISARYDSSQYTCAADNGQGTCYAGSPISDLNWLTGGDGSRADLVIALRAERDGQVLQERTLTVPYAGQPTALLP